MMRASNLKDKLTVNGKEVKLACSLPETTKALASRGGIGESGSLNNSKGSVYSRLGDSRACNFSLLSSSISGGLCVADKPAETVEDVGVEAGFPPSLVGHSITQHSQIELSNNLMAEIGCVVKEVCPDSSWLKGVCEHGNVRWLKLPCKRRTCEVCGKERKHLLAWRIALGIEKLGGENGAGWFVGTFDYDISKGEAVKVQNKFIRWLRARAGSRVEYASVWEVTRKGRLHSNLVFAPWQYIPQAVLSAKWERFGGGKRVWIERVPGGIGVEVAKSRERIGNYMAKFDQMVLNGRGVNYSKGFPKLPDREVAKREGFIKWHWVGSLEGEADIFESELQLHYWVEVAPGEFAWYLGENCHCFDIVEKADTAKSPGL